MTINVPFSQRVLIQTAEVLREKSAAFKFCYADLGKDISAAANTGNQMTIRKPSKPTTGYGADITSTNRDFVEDTVTIVTERIHAAVDFPPEETTFKITTEQIDKRWAEPAGMRLARQADDLFFRVMLGLPVSGATSAINTMVATGGERTRVVRNPNNAITTADISQMNAALSAGLFPEDRRVLFAGAYDHGDFVESIKGLFNPQVSVGDAYRDGMVAKNHLGLDWYKSQSVPTLTIGTAQSGGTLSASVTEGATSIAVTGATSGGTLLAGQKIYTTAKQIDPQTQQVTNVPYFFTVAADVTLTGGAGTITLTKPFKTVSGSGRTYANVNALPASGSAVTIVDNNSTYAANSKVGQLLVAWHPDAIARAVIALPKTSGMGILETDFKAKENDIALRYGRFKNGQTDVLTERIDLQIGFANVYPEGIVSCLGRVG